MSTNFSTKCEILGEVHSESFWNERLEDFRNYHDIGLPLAYLYSMGLVELKKDTKAEEYIEETWISFCEGIEIDAEKEYEDLDEMIEESPINQEEDEE